jgi:hypothetical protein
MRAWRQRARDRHGLETGESSIAGMPPGLIMRLQLVVEELFVNTVTYSHGGASEAPVDVSMCIDADRVTLVYEDSAPAFQSLRQGRVARPGRFARDAERPPPRRVSHYPLAERCDYARRQPQPRDGRAPGPLN